MSMRSQQTIGLNDYIQLYNQLSKQRDALVEALDAKIGLKKSNPEAYQQYQHEIRSMNRRLRLIRMRLMDAEMGV